jgi:RNA polymerase sigma-54 factor
MKLSLDIKTSLSQTLTPQQIQYLKLLQLPIIQLEQQVMQEIELNPMLEEISDFDIEIEQPKDFSEHEHPETDFQGDDDTSHESLKQQFNDDKDPFEFYKVLWEDDSASPKQKNNSFEDDDDGEPFQIRDTQSFFEELVEQLRLQPITQEEFILGTHIIWNIDDDGYLRRALPEIVEETNNHISELNLELQESEIDDIFEEMQENYNPARQFTVSESGLQMLDHVRSKLTGILINNAKKDEIIALDGFDFIDLNQAEKVLGIIQTLDPPGIGSRDIRECLLSQLYILPKTNAAQKLAIEILENAYDAFTKKHYSVITKNLEVGEEYLREALEVIRRLNPKPGGGAFQSETNTVIPDFIVAIDDETNELMITVNDSTMPQIQLSTAYDKLKKEAKLKKFNKDTKNWIRNKYEDAKFLIQAIRQRKATMLKVMTAIAHKQKDFFEEGQSGLKPLIYKDIAEETGLDISTVCRIVNGKYVQTEFGTYELKFFFSESLPNDEGEEVSTRVIKQIIVDIIGEESKSKPLSDEKISKYLKDKGYNVARRTVAKYREQLKIPVARLRKEL